MPLKETYLAVKNLTIPHQEIVVDVTPLRKGSKLSPLAPEAALSKQWSQNGLVWKEYVERYYQQIQAGKEAMNLLTWLIETSARETVWLVGLEKEYPGPRFLIIEVVDKVHHARGIISSPREYSTYYALYKNLDRGRIALMKKGKIPILHP